MKTALYIFLGLLIAFIIYKVAHRLGMLQTVNAINSMNQKAAQQAALQAQQVADDSLNLRVTQQVENGLWATYFK